MAAYPEMPCLELVELITDYLEGTLSEVDRLRFEQHLAECRHCRAYLLQMRQTIQASGKLPEETIPAEVKSQLLRAFRDWKARGQRASVAETTGRKDSTGDRYVSCCTCRSPGSSIRPLQFEGRLSILTAQQPSFRSCPALRILVQWPADVSLARESTPRAWARKPLERRRRG